MFSSQKIKASDVIEVEAALRGILRARYPEVRVEEGSALNDLVIKSLGYLAAAIRTEANEVKNRFYLDDLAEGDIVDSQTLLEDLATNFLVSTEDAPPRRGLVTFTFSSKITRSIPASILCTRGDSLITVKLIDSSADVSVALTDYIETTLDGEAVYQFSVLMETVNTSEIDIIDPGEFTSSEELTGLVKVENTSPFIGITDTDFTTTDIVDRISYAQTFRGFSTRNSIRATLLDEGIANLKKVIGIGAGDAEMSRDLIPSSVAAVRFHSLGMVNVVVGSLLDYENASVTGDPLTTPAKPIIFIDKVIRSGVELTQVSDFTTVRYTRTRTDGVLNITSSTITSGQVLEADTVSISVPDSDDQLLPGSSKASKYNLTQPAGDGAADSVSCYVDNNIPIITALIESDDYNTLGSDIACIGCPIVELIIPSISIKLASGVSTSTLSEGIVKRLVSQLVNNWSEDHALPLSDIITTIMLTFGGQAISASLPQGIKYIVYLPDGRFVGYSTTDVVDVEDTTKQLSSDSISQTNLLNLQVSDRVLRYIVRNENISVGIANV